MKTISSLLFLCFSFFMAIGQSQESSAKLDPGKKTQIVDAACGECKFGLKGTTCDLAIRIDGKAYLVTGTDIDSHGDAHAKDGFCKAISKAEVQGEIVNDRFVATYFKLVDEPKPAKKK